MMFWVLGNPAGYGAKIPTVMEFMLYCRGLTKKRNHTVAVMQRNKARKRDAGASREEAVLFHKVARECLTDK